jgi:transcriptional regulator with XRE-family HTH domain
MLWPQYQRFRQFAKDYQTKSGETQGVISGKLGINPFTYRNYLYGSKKPGIKTLKAAARLFGCSITEFIDDPGISPPGIDKEPWASASEWDRALGRAILEDLKSIQDDEKDAYYDLWKQGVFKGLAKIKAEESRKQNLKNKGALT